jgi:hypothetical protein
MALDHYFSMVTTDNHPWRLNPWLGSTITLAARSMGSINLLDLYILAAARKNAQLRRDVVSGASMRHPIPDS